MRLQAGPLERCPRGSADRCEDIFPRLSGARGFPEKRRKFSPQVLAGSIQPGFDTAFRAAGDLADLPIAQVLIVVKQEGGLQVVRKAIDGRCQRRERFTLFEHTVRGRTVVRHTVGRRHAVRAIVLIGGVEAHGGMPLPPAMVVVAEIGEDGEEPGRETGVGCQTVFLLVETDKDLRHQIVGVGGVVQVSPRKREERLLPPGHQTVERGVITALKRLKVGTIVVGGRGH